MSENKLSKIVEQRKVFGKITLISLGLFVGAFLLTIAYYPNLIDFVLLFTLPVMCVNYGLYLGLGFAEKVLTK